MPETPPHSEQQSWGWNSASWLLPHARVVFLQAEGCRTRLCCSPKPRVAPDVTGALFTQVCSAGAENENHPTCVPSSVGISPLVIALECSIVTLISKTPSRPSGAGHGPLTLASFLFVLYLCFCQAPAWGVPAASTTAFYKTQHQKYGKARPHLIDTRLPRTFSQG